MPRRKQTEGEKKLTSARWLKTLACPRPRYPVLSGNGRVSEATRARVVQYAKEKNYVPICWHAGW